MPPWLPVLACEFRESRCLSFSSPPPPPLLLRPPSEADRSRYGEKASKLLLASTGGDVSHASSSPLRLPRLFLDGLAAQPPESALPDAEPLAVGVTAGLYASMSQPPPGFRVVVVSLAAGLGGGASVDSRLFEEVVAVPDDGCCFEFEGGSLFPVPPVVPVVSPATTELDASRFSELVEPGFGSPAGLEDTAAGTIDGTGPEPKKSARASAAAAGTADAAGGGATEP